MSGWTIIAAGLALLLGVRQLSRPQKQPKPVPVRIREQVRRRR